MPVYAFTVANESGGFAWLTRELFPTLPATMVWSDHTVGNQIVGLLITPEKKEESVKAWDALNHTGSDVAPTLGQNTGQATGRAGVIYQDEPTPADGAYQASMFSPEDSPARTSAWQDDALDSLVTALASGSSSPVSSLKHAPHGWSSKTSLASCHRTGDGTWEPSSGTWGNMGMGSPGVCWTLNGSEFPNAAAACSLSDILEDQVPRRYWLSGRAAAGILRRAGKRGRTLPRPLRRALEAVAASEPTPNSTED